MTTEAELYRRVFGKQNIIDVRYEIIKNLLDHNPLLKQRIHKYLIEAENR